MLHLFLGWKSPISVHHGYTPDISAFLQYQFFQKVYFKIDEVSPKSDEAPGFWLAVSDTVGDAMTFDIHSVKSGKVFQRSAIRAGDPSQGGFHNNRVRFPEEEDEENPSLFEEDESTTPIPSPSKPKSPRTNKHKVKWHKNRRHT